MVFGLFASVANDLMFLSVQVRLLIYTCYRPITCRDLCTVYTVYFNGFEAAVSASCGTVANARFLVRI